jgi:hypothetical protein
MLKRLLTPILLLGHLFTMQPADPHERMVNTVMQSVVKIDVDMGVAQGSCSGEVVAPRRVLTAAHCLGDALVIEGQSARPIAIDEYQDLLLLDAVTVRPALTLRAEPVARFEPLTAIGFAWGWTKAMILQVFPVLVHFSPDEDTMAPGIFVQGQYIGGMSGGPVVDQNGQQVGIVQQGNQGVGYGVGADAIADFLANQPPLN